MILQERGQADHSRKNYGGDSYQTGSNKGKATDDTSTRIDWFREERAARKQKLLEAKEILKATNPYAKSMPENYFKCNQPRHESNDCPFRKTVNW